jgi:hypothetical protein
MDLFIGIEQDDLGEKRDGVEQKQGREERRRGGARFDSDVRASGPV